MTREEEAVEQIKKLRAWNDMTTMAAMLIVAVHIIEQSAAAGNVQCQEGLLKLQAMIPPNER